MNDRFTPKQIRFCNEYIRDCNATAAAVRAGYSKKTAKEIGHENLTKPHIATLLERIQSELAVRTETSADWVVRSLRENHEQAKDNGDLAQSNRALELIGRHLGMFGKRTIEAQSKSIIVVTGIDAAMGSSIEELNLIDDRS
jgi:phage terminase small subunit